MPRQLQKHPRSRPAPLRDNEGLRRFVPCREGEVPQYGVSWVTHRLTPNSQIRRRCARRPTVGLCENRVKLNPRPGSSRGERQHCGISVRQVFSTGTRCDVKGRRNSQSFQMIRLSMKWNRRGTRRFVGDWSTYHCNSCPPSCSCQGGRE